MTYPLFYVSKSELHTIIVASEADAAFLPSDASEITRAVFDSYSAGFAAGQVLGLDANNNIILVTPPAAPPKPRIVTATRFLIALDTLGLLAAWNGAVAASPKPKDQIHANRNADFQEDNPKLARIAALANPPIVVKTVFDTASTLL